MKSFIIIHIQLLSFPKRKLFFQKHFKISPSIAGNKRSAHNTDPIVALYFAFSEGFAHFRLYKRKISFFSTVACASDLYNCFFSPLTSSILWQNENNNIDFVMYKISRFAVAFPQKQKIFKLCFYP